eukprot:907338-Pyramimonas_sp.AAC.1
MLTTTYTQFCARVCASLPARAAEHSDAHIVVFVAFVDMCHITRFANQNSCDKTHRTRSACCEPLALAPRRAEEYSYWYSYYKGGGVAPRRPRQPPVNNPGRFCLTSAPPHRGWRWSAPPRKQRPPSPATRHNPGLEYQTKNQKQNTKHQTTSNSVTPAGPL